MLFVSDLGGAPSGGPQGCYFDLTKGATFNPRGTGGWSVLLWCTNSTPPAWYAAATTDGQTFTYNTVYGGQYYDWSFISAANLAAQVKTLGGTVSGGPYAGGPVNAPPPVTTPCGYDGQPAPCCAGYVALKQTTGNYPKGSCGPVGGRILTANGYVTVNADGSIAGVAPPPCGYDGQPAPCCAGYVALKQKTDLFLAGSCAPLSGILTVGGAPYQVQPDGTLKSACPTGQFWMNDAACHAPGDTISWIGDNGRTNWCTVPANGQCGNGATPPPVPQLSARFDDVNNCIVQPFDSTKQSAPTCNSVDPSILSLVRAYGIAELQIPKMTPDGKTWAGPAVPTGAYVPAVLSPAPRPPNDQERLLIRQRDIASDAGDTDIYRFDWNGVHYVAWYFPNNAFTRQAVTTPDKNTGQPRNLSWLLGTVHIEPWEEGWDNVASVLSETALNVLAAPFRAAGYLLKAVNDVLRDLLCGNDVRGAATVGIAAAAQAAGIPAAQAAAIFTMFCGANSIPASCPKGFHVYANVCVQDTNYTPWIIGGLAAAGGALFLLFRSPKSSGTNGPGRMRRR